MSFSIQDKMKIKPALLVIMGVAGCGKSTLAQELDQYLHWPFQEGDDLHPQANIEKMSHGHPLNDEDRWPWLEKCHEWLLECEKNHEGKGVLTCSALKRSYRDCLRKAIKSPFYFLYLKVPYEILLKRLETRKGHFMPVSLLDSQLESLEPLQADEPYLEIDMAHPPEVVVQNTLRQLQNL